jgi:hypothetical protein
MRKLLAIPFMLMAIAAIVVFPSSSQAIPITGDMASSTEGLANFTGSLVFSASDANTATLTVTLTNTTGAPVTDALITGFVLNNPGDAITGITSFSAPNVSFQQLGLSDNGESGAPFGNFDFGAALGGNFLGGGNPNAGIAIGSTGIFEFGLTGTGFNTLTDMDFVNELSADPGGEGAQFMVVRFRGLEPEDELPADSDKVPAAVPEPSTLFLLGSGLIGLGLLGRRKFGKN